MNCVTSSIVIRCDVMLCCVVLCGVISEVMEWELELKGAG